MKLSDAIRKGIAMDGPQCTERYFTFNGNHEMVSCCALGAAALGAGFSITTDLNRGVFSFLWDKFGDDYLMYKDAIIAANDRDHMTREFIADWLEQQGA